MRSSNLVFIGFAAIAGLLLLTEHRAHVLGLLPYLFLLICPLMHLFHHGGHHGHHSANRNADTGAKRSNEGKP